MFKLHFLKRNKKECIMSYNWFQIFCIIKTCPLLWKYMFIEWSWWKAKSYKNVKFLKFWKKGLQSKRLIFLIMWQKKMFNGLKMSNFRCTSHVQEIIFPKNMFGCSLKLMLGFSLKLFAFLAINQNIYIQLCMNVKIH
jgi:hypothetical protein